MMDYKEMSAIIKDRVREINYKKMIRARRIKQISFTASGLCAAAIVGFGIWHNKDVKNAVHYEPDKNIIEESATTSLTSDDEIITTSSVSAKTTKDITTSVTSAAHKAKYTTVTTTENKVVTMMNTKPVETMISAETALTTVVTQNIAISPSVSTTISLSSETYDFDYDINEVFAKVIKSRFSSNAKIVGNTLTFNDDDGVKHEYPIFSANGIDVNKLIRIMGEIPASGVYEIGYAGIYQGSVTEENTPFDYQHMFLSMDEDIIYTIDMTLYYVKDENGERAFAVKFPQSDDYYLYKITKGLNGRKGTYIDENNVKHDIVTISTDTMPIEEVIEMVGDININDWIFTYSGLYNGNIDEYTHKFNHSTYKYIPESETMLGTYSLIYCVRTDEGEKAYAVKYKQSNNYYLYTVTKTSETPMEWYEIPKLSETAGTPFNYFESKKNKDVSLDNKSIDEVNSIIGDIVVIPHDEYTFAGKYDKNIDLGSGFQYYLFTEYKYDYDTQTLYHVYLGARMIQLENGEEAYLIKMLNNKNDDSFYLYTLSKKVDGERDKAYDDELNYFKENILIEGDDIAN